METRCLRLGNVVDWDGGGTGDVWGDSVLGIGDRAERNTCRNIERGGAFNNQRENRSRLLAGRRLTQVDCVQGDGRILRGGKGKVAIFIHRDCEGILRVALQGVRVESRLNAGQMRL